MSSTSMQLVLFLLVPLIVNGFQQLFPHVTLASRRRRSSPTETSQCAPLKNMESYFSVTVEVGTPGQKFAVVADTGSDNVIIPSCACQDSGYCDADAKCFRGTNKSSTFYLSSNGSKEGPPVLQMMFGSGEVDAVIGSDMVTVGGLKTMMRDGVLLMIENQLQIEDAGGFQGILGLGPPKNETAIALAEEKEIKEMEKQQKAMEKEYEKQNKAMAAAMKNRSGNASMEDAMPLDEAMQSKDPDGPGAVEQPKEILDANTDLGAAIASAIAGMSGAAEQDAASAETLKVLNDLMKAGEKRKHASKIEAWRAPAWRPTHTHAPAAPKLGKSSFLESAGVSHFSICFRDQGQDGALRLNPPKAETSLQAIGTNHWGVDFQGISVGKSTAKVKFCTPADKPKGQETTCGGIPDSGTTLLMAPASQIDPLYEDLCDSWERCRNVVDEGLGKMKSEIFQLLLSQCAEWKDDSGMDELPPMYLHVAGADGTKQTLKLDGSSYIFETIEQETVETEASMAGFAAPELTGKNRTVCMPAISGHDMETELNGPVWILGSPLFYQYNVGFELDEVNFKSSVSFEELDEEGSACGCEETTDDTLALRGETPSDRQHVKRKARALNVPPRVSQIDVSRGL